MKLLNKELWNGPLHREALPVGVNEQIYMQVSEQVSEQVIGAVE